MTVLVALIQFGVVYLKPRFFLCQCFCNPFLWLLLHSCLSTNHSHHQTTIAPYLFSCICSFLFFNPYPKKTCLQKHLVHTALLELGTSKSWNIPPCSTSWLISQKHYHLQLASRSAASALILSCSASNFLASSSCILAISSSCFLFSCLKAQRPYLCVGVYRVYQLCLGSTALFFSTSLRLWKNPSRKAWHSGCLMQYITFMYSI